MAVSWIASRAADAPVPTKTGIDAAADANRKAADLIADLSSPDYRLRERAGRELARRGELVLTELRAALAATDDPEASRRLGVLVRKLEHDRLVAPKRVTLHLKDKPLKEAIDSIAKQTGYRIDFNTNRGETTYTFDMDDVPFWQAIDLVGNAGGLTIYPEHEEDGSIRAYEQDSFNPHVAYSGPFRFLATNISSNRNLQLSGLNRRGGGRNQNEQINLNFQIQSEPKTPILATTFTELTSAVDDTGASLTPPANDPNFSQRSSYYNGGYRGYNVYANMNLFRGGRGATIAKSIKGKVGVQMLAGTRPELIVADPVGLKSKKVVGRSVELHIESLTENNNQYSLSITVKKLGSSGNEHDYAWSNNVWQKLELLDDKGQKLKNNGANNQNNTPNVVQMSMTFSRDDRNGKKVGKPVKLIYNEWITAVTEVPFEFKDIPLP